MSAAVKNLSARAKRAKLIAAMGLVSRDDRGFSVKSPSRNREKFRVWRDEKGRIRCSCAEFEEESREEVRFRCEHILAVKYHLEPPKEELEQFAAASEAREGEGREQEVSEAQTVEAAEEATVDSPASDGERKEADGADASQLFPHLLKELSAPIPRELVRRRVGWTDSSGTDHEIDYIEWHTVADLLDRIYPEWSHSVKDIHQVGDLLAVTASITILGVTREGVGTGAAYDEKGIKKAEHDALKRAAVKFGIARELYKRDEEETAAHSQPVVRFPLDPVARNTLEAATARQLAAIRAIANAIGIDAETECVELLNCKLEELSRRAASAFIDHLKSKQAPSADEVRQVS